MPGLDPRRADLNVAGSILLDTILRRLGAVDLTLCDLALREGLVLDYIHRNTALHPEDRTLSGRSAPERGRAWRALRLLGRTRAAGGEAGAEHLRSNPQRPRPRRTRTGMARIRGPAARRRRAHQLRAPSPAFLLPDQEWRLARVRAARDRGHRARRPLPSAGHAEEVARGLRRPRWECAGNGPGALRHRSTRRRARSQSRPGAHGDRSAAARRGLPRAAEDARRRGTGALGRASPRCTARARAGSPHPLRGGRGRSQGTTA